MRNPESTITLTQVASESGSVDSNGVLSASYIVGDSDNDAGVRAYFSFDIAGLSGAEIKTATLTFTVKSTAGNPWFVPPFLHVEQVDYGARALKAADFGIATTSSEVTRYDLQPPGKIDVQYRVSQALLAPKTRFQVRLRMASSSNYNKQADYLEFIKAELTVTYVK